MRIFARLQEGWSYEEIGRQEGVTSERIRQIVKQALEKREVEAGRDHALLQLARLGPALRLAAEEVAKGEVSAIAPLLRVLERLDKYHGAGAATGGSAYDNGGRERLLDKLNAMAQRALANREAGAASGQVGTDGGAQGATEEGAQTPWDFRANGEGQS
jgi:hypothetical protein